MHGFTALTPSERSKLALGRQSLERGEAETALRHLCRLSETRPGFADLHYLVSLAHEQKGDLRAAVRSLERALSINPNYAEARLALLTLHERLGEFERSRELAEATAEIPAGPTGEPDPTTSGKLANLQAALGDAYRDTGEFREAILAYRRALDRCPRFCDIRQRLAITLREAGLPHQAIQEFKRVLRTNPRYLAACVQLGLTYYSLGRSNEAVQLWQEVLTQDPEREDARMYLCLVKSRPQKQPAENENAVANSLDTPALAVEPHPISEGS